MAMGNPAKSTRTGDTPVARSHAQIKEVVLKGVSLDDDKREKFNRIEHELEMLSHKFSENVLDATKKFEKLITNKKYIDGLPATVLGASRGHLDNTPIINQILKLLLEKVKLLNYNNYAEVYHKLC
ncbi:hypothetical protein GOBAR_AA28827 [Gossypium barbadense]|uniref:Uncharacterized protein n=1 Tax=Gossypium barbadense TaxID=3634 RepID=A0A2P5WL81_GOSBA|nr:hypothetical protein GOBAR_AA28827 [Gossypium barbadense]